MVKEVAGMPAEVQVKAIAKKLQEPQLEFDGKVTPGIDSAVCGSVFILTDDVTDISRFALAGLSFLVAVAVPE